MSVTPSGPRDSVAQWGQCVPLVPWDKKPSLISIICFPRWQGQGNSEAWWKDSSCKGDTHSAAQHSLWFPKLPALTGDAGDLVGFTVRESWSSCFQSHYTSLYPCCNLMSLTKRYKEEETCYLKKVEFQLVAQRMNKKRMWKWERNYFDTCESQIQLYFSPKIFPCSGF